MQSVEVRWGRLQHDCKAWGLKERWKRGGSLMLWRSVVVWFSTVYDSLSNVWISVRVNTDNMPITQSLERGGDYRAMASYQGALSEGEKREKESGVWLVDGVEVSVMACFINSCQCLPMHPSLVFEGQSLVYHSRCFLASSISLIVLACFAKCGHCVRRSESGIALGMMSLQSSHLTHAC